MKLNVIVSLTSWKKRINTVGKTIYSIIKNCEPYKIVLCLASSEFPQKEKELPEDLITLQTNNIIEILWVNENTYAFKKVLYTLDKYREYPVISADDDCIYIENYVKILYDKWITDKNSIWTYKRCCWLKNIFGNGPACLYPPYCFKEYGLKCLTQNIIHTYHDDIYYGILAKKLKIQIKQALDNNKHSPYKFHDEMAPLSRGKEVSGSIAVQICEREIKL